MRGGRRLVGRASGLDKAAIRSRAAAALNGSDLRGVFGAPELAGDYEAAGAALRAVIAERMSEYAVGAMRLAKKRKMRMGAAAVIIAAKK